MARSFAIILVCVVVIFTTGALQSRDVPAWEIDVLLRFHWFGIIFLPAAYLHLSDAVLVTAGRPSRGRRRFAIRFMYAVSAGFLLLLAAGRLLGPLVLDEPPAPHLQLTVWSQLFTLYYIGAMVWAGCDFARAYRRMLTRSWPPADVIPHGSATAPALGSYPYLLYGSSLAAHFPLLFWIGSVFINILVGGLVIVMAYAVAFFGVSWPGPV